MAIIIILAIITLYLYHYISTQHEKRIANSHERRAQHLEQTMERIREADRKSAAEKKQSGEPGSNVDLNN